MFREPMDVQRTLRADGVPATVAFQGGELSDAPPLPRGCRAPSYRTKRTPSCSPRFSAGPRRVLGAAQAACPVARDLPPHPRHPLLPRLLQRGRWPAVRRRPPPRGRRSHPGRAEVDPGRPPRRPGRPAPRTGPRPQRTPATLGPSKAPITSRMT